MESDILLQAGLILLTLFMFLSIHDIPKRIFTKLRHGSRRSEIQANRHFILGAQLLSQAKSSPNSNSTRSSLAKQAQSHAEKAISLSPKDAASHILKSLSLDLQGLKSAAIESLDTALSPPAVASLSQKEKGDALFKRAELRMAAAGRGRRRGRVVDASIEDLNEAVKLKGDNVKAWCLLADCYEMKKMEEEARRAYEEALCVDPGSAAARAALDRLEATEPGKP